MPSNLADYLTPLTSYQAFLSGPLTNDFHYSATIIVVSTFQFMIYFCMCSRKVTEFLGFGYTTLHFRQDIASVFIVTIMTSLHQI
jgi:hypothetical protein